MPGNSFGNRFVGWILQSPLHGMLDRSTILISVTGRNSGKQIVTPVNYTREGDDLWVTSQRSRQWWRNCRQCTQIKVLLMKTWVDAVVEVIDQPDEVPGAFEHLFELNPVLARMYGVPMNSQTKLDDQKLAALAEKSVVLRIRPLN